LISTAVNKPIVGLLDGTSIDYSEANQTLGEKDRSSSKTKLSPIRRAETPSKVGETLSPIRMVNTSQDCRPNVSPKQLNLTRSGMLYKRIKPQRKPAAVSPDINFTRNVRLSSNHEDFDPETIIGQLERNKIFHLQFNSSLLVKN